MGARKSSPFCRVFIKESFERSRIVGGEGRGAGCAEFARSLLQALGVAGGEDDLGSFGARRRAVSSPMPALWPITTTVCPRSSGSRCAREPKVALSMVPPIGNKNVFGLRSTSCKSACTLIPQN
jgi:hypothetical protein